MITLINKKLANRKGFTLIELLVVLAVLAIIALIAIPNFIGIQEQSKVKSDISSCQSMKKSIELAVVANNITTTGTLVFESGKENAYTGSLSKELLKNYIEVDKKPQSSKFKATFTVDAGTGKVSVAGTSDGKTIDFEKGTVAP